MKCQHVALLLVAFAIASVSFTANAQLNVAQINELVSPAVVYISVEGVEEGKGWIGSGFIVDHRGIVITNEHVVRDAKNIVVVLTNNDKYLVEELLHVDARKDFAIVRIAGFGLPTVRMGNSDKVKVGDGVVAIGNPQGFTSTVSDGIISQIRDADEIPGAGYGYKLIQTTAPISGGSSGGPLLSMSGEVIGINSSGWGEGQNLNFALPINYTRAYLPEKLQINEDSNSKTGDEEAKNKPIVSAFNTVDIPSTAQKYLEIASGDCRLYFNDNKWILGDGRSFILKHSSGKVYVNVLEMKEVVGLASMEKQVLVDYHEKYISVETISSQDRTLNKLSLKVIELLVTDNNKGYRHSMLLFSDSMGAAVIDAYTRQDDYQKYGNDIEDLLRGFTAKR